MSCRGLLVALGMTVVSTAAVADVMVPIPLTSQVTQVQPMTGIVLWSTNEDVGTAPIQLEYSYLSYSQVIQAKGKYDWAPVEKLLDEIASRKHQAVLRWYDTYVGQTSGVPAYIRKLPGYRDTVAKSEKKKTGFPDWSHPELRRCILEFFERFAEKYDRDPRLAFLQVGFGLWSEYHIYDGPMELGKTFPSLEFQTEFARHMQDKFRQTPWMISVDAAGEHAPFASDKSLLALPFGEFDDSFNHARHAEENEPNWDRFGRDRWQVAPAGGEFSFFETKDQKLALSPRGPHGIEFTKQAAKFHISFMIGDAQPKYQKPDRIRQAGTACGYRFRVTRFVASETAAEVTIENTGIAPIYYDAFPKLGEVRSTQSLKGLLPMQSQKFAIAAGKTSPQLTIESDRLVPGQRIEFDANLK